MAEPFTPEMLAEMRVIFEDVEGFLPATIRRLLATIAVTRAAALEEAAEMVDRLERLEQVRFAAQALADHCRKSVDVGPISLAPATEAALWRILLDALEKAPAGDSHHG